MKKLLPIVIALFSICGLAQAPNGFNYQASVRDANGDLVTEQSVSFKFHIIQGTQTAAPTYTETHATNTDDLGQVSVVIGQGNATSGTFSSIDWSLGSYFLKIEVELSAGSGYVDLGTTQFMSVPYALYAQNAGGSLPQGTSNGDTLKWNASTSSWDISSASTSANNAFEVITSQVNYYSNDSASSGGEVVADGGSSVIARGVVWDVNPDPIIDGDKTTDGIGSGTFTSELTNLTESTSYYYRAYATNSNKTVYGSTYSFQTMSLTDDNDGDGYTVQNGDCNDLDFNINPSALEIQDDGIDQNCDGTDSLSPVYLSANGVTIKAHSWAKVGDYGEINGQLYTIVDRETLLIFIETNDSYDRVCTSLIDDMAHMFNGKTINRSLRSWDTSNVTDMKWMFQNSNIGGTGDLQYWDVSSVTDFSYMFNNTNFNGDVRFWNTSSATDMSGMFRYNPQFNQIISDWDTSSVTNMSRMFENAESFNRFIGNWDTNNVTDMSYMFKKTMFNHPIGDWDTSSVTNMGRMFFDASKFNRPIGDWDTSNVTNMVEMFINAADFNQDLSAWNVVNVTNYTSFSNGANSWTLPKPNFN